MDKAGRELLLFNAFINGKKVNKADFVEEYHINDRTFERDIENIRNMLAEVHSSAEIKFDKAENHYYMRGVHLHENNGLSAVEAVTVLKVLFQSKALRKDEMYGLARSLFSAVVPDERRKVIDECYKELDAYISPSHGKAILKMLEDLLTVIKRHLKITISYVNEKGEIEEYPVIPYTFIFLDFYFYLIAFKDVTDNHIPEMFRVDKIESFKLLNEKYDPNRYEAYYVEYNNKINQMEDSNG